MQLRRGFSSSSWSLSYRSQLFSCWSVLFVLVDRIVLGEHPPISRNVPGDHDTIGGGILFSVIIRLMDF